MSQETQGILARMRAQRETWKEVGAFEVLLRRPQDADIGEFAGSGRLAPKAAVVKYTVDWRKVTEATLLGAAVGADVPVPYVGELWSEYLGDHVEDCSRLYSDLVELINQRHKTEADAAKN